MSARGAPAGVAALVALALVTAGPAGAEVRRMEAVGAVPIDPRTRSSEPLREAAVEEAQREAVLRVASDLLLEAESPSLGDGEEGAPDLEAVLGDEMVPYTSRFRIREDRGERPALFADSPGVTSEYVVVVETWVDVERVRRRLEEEGLLEPAPGRDPAAARAVPVEVRGLETWAAFRALEEALLGGAGAESVQPLALERGRALLRVESEDPPEVLLERLLGSAPPELGLRAGPSDDGRLRIAVSASPDLELPREPDPRGERPSAD